VTAITLERVSKRYGRTIALDDVSFSCLPGTVTAFCGPNGAGKSTALRVLTGIAQPDSGTARIGRTPVHDLPSPGNALGVLLDASAFHPGRTVIETLRLGALTIGTPRRCAAECLERVGLTSVGRRRVGRLSLGMRQRLGIAHALLGDPSALVLDEPSNGLDPSGIEWLDGFLAHFARDGGTVLISTHHLAGVERIADRLVAISRGRVVADVDVAEIERTSQVEVASTDRASLLSALGAADIDHDLEGDRVVAEAPADAVGRVLHQHGVVITRLTPVRRRLDEFLSEVTEVEFAGASR
jgi:ABC-2 type transport system ATP-binding protein